MTAGTRWRESVSVEMILETYKKNVATSKNIIKEAVGQGSPPQEECSCKDAMKYAVVTDRKSIIAKRPERRWT